MKSSVGFEDHESDHYPTPRLPLQTDVEEPVASTK
jgi:hypothetical protein